MLSRHYAKHCELEDFSNPDLMRAIADVAPVLTSEQPDRKGWEYGMAALFLAELGHLDRKSRVLDVGAGADPILYWLANRTAETVGVDMYGDAAFADREGELAMLNDPDSHAPYPYARDRLTMRFMDARSLDFPAESFDAVVSFSSIEHFGGSEGIAAAAREIGRVLRPSGYAFIVTEAFVRCGPLARPTVQSAIRLGTLGRRFSTATRRERAWPEVLTAKELRRWIIEPSGLKLMQPLRLGVSRQTLSRRQKLRPDGTSRVSEAGDGGVLLTILGSTFTSVALPLAKPAR
jgi:SAM-dependent methyltransferase